MKEIDGKGDSNAIRRRKLRPKSSEEDSSDQTETGTSEEEESDSEESSSEEESSENSDDSSDSPPESNKEKVRALGKRLEGSLTKRQTLSRNATSTPDIELKSQLSSTRENGPPKRRRRRQRPLTICLSHCRYDLVRSTSETYGLIEVSEDTAWTIYWTDYSVSLERAVEMRRFQIVNHFPGMNEICRKDLLARNLNRMKRVFPEEYNIYPMTWCLPADNNELQAYSQARKGKTYICKPEMGCQGRGIFLVKNIKDLNPFGRIICQVYIQKPFLIDHLKFDLRIYVLITSCDPLRVWVYKEGLARFATAKYRQPTQNNTENSYMHLTNYAVNKYSRDFIVDEEAGTKRKLTTVYNLLDQRGFDVETMEKQVDDVILKTILSAQPVLKHHYRTCFPHHDICSACFEILGFDILLDHKLKPYVIEVNHSPSFHTDTKMDREIKNALLNDTFAMLYLKHLDRAKVEREDRRRVQERLSSKLSESKNSAESMKKDLKKQSSVLIKEEISPPPKPDYNEIQFDWEKEHKGDYRLIYPLPDSYKYDRFLVQNQVSLYQETAASQARANLTRVQMDEYNLKKQAEEQKRVSVTKETTKEKVRPESPNSQTTTTTKEKGTRNKKEKKADSGSDGHEGGRIISEEECDRVKLLMQRGMLVRSLGVELQVYNLLTAVGNLKKSDHDEFRRKHGFTASSSRLPPTGIVRNEAYVYPSNSTSKNPSRQETEAITITNAMKDASTTTTTPRVKSANPGGHQIDYLKAKIAQSTDLVQYSPIQNTTKSYGTKPYSTVRWHMDKGIRMKRDAEQTLPPPLSAFSRVYTAVSLSPKSSNKRDNLSRGRRDDSINVDLPTGAEQIKAITKGGLGSGSFLNRNMSEMQRRYNSVHDRKMINALSALRHDLKPSSPEKKEVIARNQPNHSTANQTGNTSNPAAWKWAAIPNNNTPVDQIHQPNASAPGQWASTGNWSNVSPPLDNTTRLLYSNNRVRTATNEPTNNRTVQLGRLLPTQSRSQKNISIAPSIESAAIIFPRRGNNKINIYGHAERMQRDSEGKMAVRPVGQIKYQIHAGDQASLGVGVGKKLDSNPKKEVITFEDAPLYLKGFHLSNPQAAATLKL